MKKPNTTKRGQLACLYGTRWENHFNGKGCRHCDRIGRYWRQGRLF